ncbi:MAG: imidazoleglycerol-phosphate dehydratase HisB [Acholeplasmataceae bacterium]
MRESVMERKTKETNIRLKLVIDGSNRTSIDTGIPFFNHMLAAFAFYAGFDLELLAQGDLELDDHHTVEDTGILLGRALNEALGNKAGIARFSENLTPMDESLVRVVLDISNRPFCLFSAGFRRETIGGLSLENIREFLVAFSTEARLTLHVEVLYGENDHHKAEAIFKGLGRALKQACRTESAAIPSTKGTLS